MSGADTWRMIDHSAGFKMKVRDDWTVTMDPREGVLLVSVEPDRGRSFRSNHVVTLDQLADDLELERWQAANEELLRETLREYQILDREYLETSHGRCLVRLAHHAVEGNAVTVAQTAWIDANRGFTLTTSVSTLRYVETAAQVGEVLQSFCPVTVRGR